MNNSNILIYQTEDGQTKIDVKIIDETVWLSLMQLVELFQRDKSVISKHIKNIYTEGELAEEATVAFFATVQKEGERNIEREIVYYNLDVIISVGYRVKSHRGTQFRQWATKQLKEYLVKGFIMDDERLKNAGSGNYFESLLSRIRDIRSSEKVFWRKVLEIYATSIDYDPTTKFTQEFFKTVQNKMHWAAHGHTAAEIIFERSDSNKPFMGLTSFKGSKPKPVDIIVAKNYLNKDELEILNRIVTAYLELAEIQAIRNIPMYMTDWIAKLDEFIKISGSEILAHAGKISAKLAEDKALQEYQKYNKIAVNQLSKVEQDFLNYFEQKTKLLAKKRKV